jgi:hypothetical protein
MDKNCRRQNNSLNITLEAVTQGSRTLLFTVCWKHIIQMVTRANFVEDKLIVLWFTDEYINNIFVKLILKIFALENSKRKGPNTLPRTGILSLDPFFRSAHLAKTVFSVRNNILLHRLCWKKLFNGEEDENI